jgi:hypothetical protein
MALLLRLYGCSRGTEEYKIMVVGAQSHIKHSRICPYWFEMIEIFL